MGFRLYDDGIKIIINTYEDDVWKYGLFGHMIWVDQSRWSQCLTRSETRVLKNLRKNW